MAAENRVYLNYCLVRSHRTPVTFLSLAPREKACPISRPGQTWLHKSCYNYIATRYAGETLVQLLRRSFVFRPQACILTASTAPQPTPLTEDSSMPLILVMLKAPLPRLASGQETPGFATLRRTRRRQEHRRGLAAQRGAKPRSIPRPAFLDPIRTARRRRSHRELLQRRPEPKRRADLLSSELYLDQQLFYRPRSRQRHVRSHPPITLSLGELQAIDQ